MEPHPIQDLYTALLALLPRRYQDEFGEEMKAVFAQALVDAVEAGGLAVLALMLREARDVPRLALQERWRERKLPRYIPAQRPAAFSAPIAGRAWWAALALFLIGFIGGQVGLYFGSILASIVLPWLGIEEQGQLAIDGQIPRLAWQWLSSGLQWVCMAIPPLAGLGILAVIPRTRPFLRHIREDWTLISFMLYGAALMLALRDFNEFRYAAHFAARYAAGYQVAILLALSAGVWGYLRSASRVARITALLAAVTLALLLLGTGKYLFSPRQDWPFGSEGPPVVSERWFEVLRTPGTWLWTMIALLCPWLIRRRPPVILINLALCALWLLLFRPVYPYLEIIFSRQEFRLNQLALAGVVGLLIYQVRHAGLKFHFGAPPALHLPAIAMLVGSSGLFILAERLVDINTLSASLFGLAFYGLLGLWLERARWQQGLPAALLLIGTLPFGEHLQTFIGYPVRLLTATLVRDGLANFGVHSIGIDTILVFENGISQVDLPCSGVKSLWTGGMFLLAATWIERRRFNRRWLLAAIVFAFLLFVVNLARVAALITVGQVFGWRLLAEMLHVPLGVLGFCGACLALIWLLRRFVPFQSDDALERQHPRGTVPRSAGPRWLSPALFICILLLAALYTPRPDVAAAQSAAPLVFSDSLSTEPWAFTPGEMAWLSADGPLAASRWRFRYEEYQGSLLLITSDTWRAHHRPERCFEAYGLTVNQSRSLLLSNDFPVRLLSLNAGKGLYRATAIYWLQSSERVTDDYATRIWSDLVPDRRTWVLVTTLFDQNIEPLDADLQELYAGLRQSVARRLQTGGPQ